MPAETVKILLGIAWAIVDLMVIWIALHPQKPAHRKLASILFFAIGPKTETNLMSRQEMFRASSGFFFWFMHIAVINYYAAMFIFKGSVEPPDYQIAICCFILPVLGLVFFASSFYLFIKGLLKRPKVPSFEELLEDETYIDDFIPL